MAPSLSLEELRTAARTMRLRGYNYAEIERDFVTYHGLDFEAAAELVAGVRAELEECAPLSLAEHRHRLDALLVATTTNHEHKTAAEFVKLRMRLDGVLVDREGEVAKPAAKPTDPAQALRDRLKVVRGGK